MAYVELACRLLLGGVFLAAAAKLRSRASRAAFAASVRGLPLVPSALARPVAAATVLAELATLASLAVPGWTVAGFVLAGLLLIAFSAVTAVAVRRRATVTCHCFGTSGAALGPVHLWRNSLLLAVAVTGLVSAGQPGGPVTAPAGVVASVLAAAGGVAVAVFFTDFVGLFTDPYPTKTEAGGMTIRTATTRTGSRGTAA